MDLMEAGKQLKREANRGDVGERNRSDPQGGRLLFHPLGINSHSSPQRTTISQLPLGFKWCLISTYWIVTSMGCKVFLFVFVWMKKDSGCVPEKCLSFPSFRFSSFSSTRISSLFQQSGFNLSSFLDFSASPESLCLSLMRKLH